jgi:hypothetical protein
MTPAPSGAPAPGIRSRVSPRLLTVTLTVLTLLTSIVYLAIEQTTAHAGAAARPGALGAATEPDDAVAAESTHPDAPEKAATPVARPAAKAPYDQLSGDEVAYARYLVGRHATYDAAVDVAGGAGAQYLSADLADTSAYGDSVRRLSLLYYDYGAEELVQYVVDMAQGAVAEVVTAQGVQPAPTELETDVAFDLLLQEAGAEIRAEYLDVTGERLTESAPVDVTAHSWTGGRGTNAAQQCAADRCVQVLVQTPDGPYLTTTPYVVNLSAQTVTPVR